MTGMFRANRTDGGGVVEGYYVCLNRVEHRIYSGYSETDCEDYYPDWSQIDPTTLEYIGDRDGIGMDRKEQRKIVKNALTAARNNHSKSDGILTINDAVVWQSSGLEFYAYKNLAHALNIITAKEHRNLDIDKPVNLKEE